jgi:hypothetical protein
MEGGGLELVPLVRDDVGRFDLTMPAAAGTDLNAIWLVIETKLAV